MCLELSLHNQEQLLLVMVVIQEIQSHSFFHWQRFECTFQEQGTSLGCAHACAPSLAGVLSSWVLTAAVEMASLICGKMAVAASQRQRVLLQNTLWSGNQVAYLPYGCYGSDGVCGLEQVYRLEFFVCGGSLIAHFLSIWGRASLPLQWFCAT